MWYVGGTLGGRGGRARRPPRRRPAGQSEEAAARLRRPEAARRRRAVPPDGRVRGGAGLGGRLGRPDGPEARQQAHAELPGLLGGWVLRPRLGHGRPPERRGRRGRRGSLSERFPDHRNQSLEAFEGRVQSSRMRPFCYPLISPSFEKFSWRSVTEQSLQSPSGVGSGWSGNLETVPWSVSQASRPGGGVSPRKGGMMRLEALISSSSNLSIRAVRACPLTEICQTVLCRAIRGNSISVNCTIPPSYCRPRDADAVLRIWGGWSLRARGSIPREGGKWVVYKGGLFCTLEISGTEWDHLLKAVWVRAPPL